MECPLCRIETYVVARDSDWTVAVNEDQGYLGRCFIALNRHETELTSLSHRERDSLWAWYRRVTAAQRALFQPDHTNYVFLMNVQPHLHGHVIPRYAGSRIWGGMTFQDGRLGRHYDLENVRMLGELDLDALAAHMRAALPGETLEAAS